MLKKPTNPAQPRSTPRNTSPRWWTTMAEVLCSGSISQVEVRRTPIASSGLSSAKSFVWSSRFGQAG